MSDHQPAERVQSTFLITIAELRRTLRLRVCGKIATCFTINRADKQYVVTAAHCVSDLSGLGGEIEIQIGREWRSLDARIVGTGADGADIAVMRCSEMFPSPPAGGRLELGSLFLVGQEVRFVGFPLGLDRNSFEAFEFFPIPFVKFGIVSSVGGSGSDRVVYLDGMNAQGFSGGPIYFLSNDRPTLTLGGVISGYRHTSSEVLDEHGNRTGMHVQQNTGLIRAFGIGYALDIMDAD